MRINPPNPQAGFGRLARRMMLGASLAAMCLLQAAGVWADGIVVNSSARIVMTTSTIKVNGSWVVAASGFTSGTGTVVLTATAGTKSITPNATTFYNLTIDGNGGTFNLPDENVAITNVLNVNAGTLVFDDDKNLQVTNTAAAVTAVTVGANGVLQNTGTGDFTIAGAVANAGAITFNSSDDAGNAIQIRSTVSGTKRNWQGAGTFTMTDVDVKDQTAIGGTPAGVSASSSTNSGNNVNWFFGGAVDVSGTVYNGKAEAATLNAKALRLVHYDGAIQTTYTATTDGAGVFSVTMTALSSGGTLVIYLDDTAEEGNLVYVSNGATVNDLKLYQNTVGIRTDATTLTNAKLAGADDTDNDIKYSVAGGNATFESNFELFVFSGSTYTPGGTVTADDVDLNGTLDTSTGGPFDVTVSGSWDATGGTYTSGANTTNFTTAGTDTLISGGTGASNDFHHLTFSGAGTLRPATNDIVINGNYTASAGTVDMNTNDRSITVAGNVDLTGTTYQAGSGAFTLGGSAANGTQTIDFNDLTVEAVTVNDTGDVKQLTDGVTAASFTITAGSLDFNSQAVNGSGSTLSIANGAFLVLDGDETITTLGMDTDSGTVLFDDTASLTILSAFTTYYNVTFDESGAGNPTYTLPDAHIAVNGVLTVTDGTLAYDNDKNLTVSDGAATGTAISVAATGAITNSGTGDLTIGGAVANAGSITFNSSDDAGNGIAIASVGGAVQRNWQGAGTFSMTDVSVSYQTCTGGTPTFVFVSSGANGGNNTNWLFGGGTLTLTNVEPASLVAGAESDVAVSFTLASLLPVNGKIVIDFPSTFNATGLTTVTNTLGIDGGWTVTLGDGDGTNDVVTLTRDGAGTLTSAGTAVTVTLENEVRNPQVSGLSGTYAIQTQLSDGTLIDSANAAADTFTAGALTTTNVQPASLVESSVNNVVVTFTTANPIPADGKIVVTFPTSLAGGFTFDSGGATAVSASAGFDGTLTAVVAANVVTITRAAGTSSAAGAKSITLSNIMNPAAAGSTGAYQIQTTTSAAAAIDQDTAVAADTITALATASTPVLMDSTGAATATYTVGSTTTGLIYLKVTDADENTSNLTLQTVTATLSSQSTGDVETITLTETGVATGIFAGPDAGVVYDADDAPVSGNGTLETRNGDTVTLSYVDDDDGTDSTSVAATVSADEGQILVTLSTTQTVVKVGEILVFNSTIRNQTNQVLSGFNMVVQLPGGLVYRAGSAAVDTGTFQSVETGATTQFTEFSDIAPGETRNLTFQAVVGSGATNGSFPVTLFAQVNPVISNAAQVTVVIRPDPVFTLGTLIGKVFWDVNRNGYQDPGEDGVANVVLATEQGYVMTTDSYGRFNIPDFQSGRHMVKIDRSSLPAGSKLTTSETVMINQTDAMLSKANFGVELPAEAGARMDEERRQDVEMMLQQDTAAPVKETRLEFFALTTNPDTLQTEELTGSVFATLDTDPEVRLPFRVNLNYARYVKSWKFEVVRFEPEEGKIFEHADDETFNIASVAEVDGNPLASAFLYPWQHPLADVLGNPILYGVRLTLRAADGKEDRILYRILPQDAAGGIQWTLDRLDVVEAIDVRGTSVTVTGKTHARVRARVEGWETLTDTDGNFSRQMILPEGLQTVDVELDLPGHADPVRVTRSINLKDTYLFFVGFTEYEYGSMDIKGNILSATQEDKARFNEKWYDEGRAAYYLKGKIKGKYLLTASVDTQREKRELFRNLEPEDFYPVYGDSSSVQADANDTQDRYYLLLEADKSYVKYGNFETALTGTEFSDFNRTLHGGKVHYQSLATVPGGEPKTVVTLFTATARQKAGHAEFRATGGSLYYLKHKDVVQGSEKLKLITRDQVSRLPLSELQLVAGQDYAMDYDEGRIRLYRPISLMNLDGGSILSVDPFAGNTQYLVVDYEYRAVEEIKDASVGARVSHYVVDDMVRLGGTYVQEDRSAEKYALTGLDGTLNLPLGTTVRAEEAKSTLQSTGAYVSDDGGLTFHDVEQGADGVVAEAGKIDIQSNPWRGAQIEGYYRKLDSDFSSSATLAEAGTERFGVGGTQSFGSFGDTSAYYQVENFMPGADPLAITQDSLLSDRETMTIQHQALIGKWDVTGEFRTTESDTLDENAVGAQLGYALDETTRAALSAQADLKQDGRDQVRVSGEKKIGDLATLVAAQSFGSLGTGSHIGITPGSSSTVNSILQIVDQAKNGAAPAADTGYRPATELGFKRQVGKGTEVQVGRTLGGNLDKAQTFRLTRSTDDGRTYEMVRQSDATRDISTVSDSKTVGPNSSQYNQSVTTTEKLTGHTLASQIQGTRIALPDGRGSLYQEDAATRSSAAATERQSRKLGGEVLVTEHLTVGANYEHLQDKLDTVTNNSHVGRLGLKYYEFESLSAESDWEFRRLDGAAEDTHQLVSAGRAEWKLDTDWTLLGRYEWSWTKNLTLGTDRARFSEIQSGVAYRPVEHDRLNLLAEYKYLTDQSPFTQIDIEEEESSTRNVVRAEAAYDLTPRLTWVEKIALRQNDFVISQSDKARSRTYLSAHRLNFHLTDRWDAAAEYRLIGQSLADDITTGYLAETSYRLIDSLRLAVGYAATEYDSNIAQDLGVEVNGVYFRVLYDALKDIENLIEKKKQTAESAAHELEKELERVSAMSGAERDAQEMRLRLEQARVLMDRELYDEAIEALSQGLERFGQAQRYAERAEDRDERFHFYKAQGDLFLRHEMHERAFAEYEKAYKINAFDPPLLEGMSRARAEIQRVRRVKRQIRKREADALQRIRPDAEPEKVLRQALQIHRDYGREYLKAGFAEEAMEEWKRGLELLERANIGTSEEAARRRELLKQIEALNQKAKEYLDAGDPERAREVIKKGAELIHEI